MRVDANTHEDGLRLTLTITGPEVAKAFESAWNDYRMKDAIVKIMLDQSAPLALAISEQIKIVLDSPLATVTLRNTIERGLSAAIGQVERRITDAANQAAESGVGRFFAKTFSRLKRALDSEEGQE